MKEKLTCYIVDDEYLAQEILEEYISKVSFLELIGTFPNPLEASKNIKENRPDLIFLDINMPNIDGISFLQMLKPSPMIILTTAYDQYAVKAYDLDVKDYLLKPISFERFYKGVLRLYQSQGNGEVQEKNAAMPVSEREFVFLKVGHRIQRVGILDIFLIEGMKDYLKIHTDKENILTLMSFAELEQFLHSSNFIRVHKSYMVAIDKIDHIEKNRIWIGDQIVPIGETYSVDFFNRLKGNA